MSRPAFFARFVPFSCHDFADVVFTVPSLHHWQNSDCRARVPAFFSMMEFLQAIRWHPQVYGMSARQITAILPPEHEH